MKKRSWVFVVGMLLLSAVAPTAAQASHFEAEEFPITITGTQVSGEGLNLSVEGNSVTCETVKFSGSESEPASSVTVSPTFEGCTAFGFLSATVKPSGCTFRLNVGSKISSDLFYGSIDIVCSAGSSISVSAGTCEFDIGSQNGLAGSELSVKTTWIWAIILKLSATIDVNVTKDGFLCPFSGTGTKTGTWKGKIEYTALDALKQIILWFLEE